MGHAARRAGARVTAMLLMVALAGCAAATSGTTTGTLGAMVGSGPTPAEVADFNARAQQVVARWDRSPLKAAWQDGLVLLDPTELITIPADAGFTSQRQKDALYSGHFVLGGALPSAPLTGGPS